MADAAIGVVTEAVLKTVISLAADEIRLAWGTKEELTKLANVLEEIQDLLVDAQKKQTTDQAVRRWLNELQSIALDAQIVLDELEYEVLRQKIECRKRDKVRGFFSGSNPVVYRSKMAHKIKDVLSSLEEFHKRSNQFGLLAEKLVKNSLPDMKEMRLTVPYVEDSKIVGRDNDVSEVIRLLTDSEYKDDLPIITILAMGGQGKTTLAQLIYKNEKVNRHFDKAVWVCVSDDCSVERLLGEMLQSLTGTNLQLTNIEALVKKLKEQLEGKRYLLVLDDVWNREANVWNCMRTSLLGIGGSKGSKILATTRSKDVAFTMGTSGYHELQKLTEVQSWSLFEKCAFAEGGATRTPELVRVGERICKRCGGLPLAIKVIGGLLNSKNSESEWLVIEKSDWTVYSEEKMVHYAIKLSYDHLPSLSVKQCFAYCAIFEKDTWIEKDQLIQLWMSQGLLNPPKKSHLQMEDIGEIYFNILLRNFLFQDVDDLNNITRCKMHDLVHDVSLQVSENYCYHVKDWKAESKEIKAVHILINSGERGMWKSLKGVILSKLRTLHLKNVDLSEDLFENFKCLSVLVIVNWKATELPNSIGKMKHLRFLDIIATSIVRLPKSFTKLYSLETLRVDYLEAEPKEFGNLINLRHIHLNWYMNTKVDLRFERFPKVLFRGLSQIKNLQTLPYFRVDKCKGCEIEELEHLDNLKGRLSLLSLENVENYESAVKSNLSKKSNIQTLLLKWNEREGECDDSDVMEGLKPHANLKSLTILGCQSIKFPSWMVTENELLHNLVKLSLQKLDRCERLPSLGDLPSLKYLYIETLPNVKCIGKEFYGWTSNVEGATKSSGCSSNGSEIITLFPALTTLLIRGMANLVEWSDAIGIIPTTSSSSSSSLVEEVKVFPNLEEMFICILPNLLAFPNLSSLPSLKRLRVYNCQNMALPSDWNKRYGSSPQKLGIDDDERQRHSSSSAVIVDDSDIQYDFSSLRHLELRNCDKFSGPFCNLIIKNKTCLPPLESLSIYGHPNSWPKDLHHLINLKKLSLSGNWDGEEVEVDCYPWPYARGDLVNLTSLTLSGRQLPRVKDLPHQIQYLTALTNLEISNFDGLEALPQWLPNLKGLQYLRLYDCKNLKESLSLKAVGCLPNFQFTDIRGCPLLE